MNVGMVTNTSKTDAKCRICLFTTPSVAMPTKDAIITTGDPGDAIGQEVGKSTPSVALLTVAKPQDITFRQMAKGSQ
jgi:hypothetical protein